MPVWFSKQLQEWRILASDRVTLAMGGVIAAAMAIGLLYWSYISFAAWSASILKDTAKELAELDARYGTLKNPPRDSSGLYRDGKRIGGVVKPDIDVPNGEVAFQEVSIVGELDRVTPVEFQDFILSFRGCDLSDGIRQGDIVRFTYYRARFAIVGRRPAK